MLNFKEILEELPLPPKIKENIFALQIAQKYWPQIIKPEFLKFTKPLYFNENTLFIEVPNHFYSQILASYTLEILENLEKFIPKEKRPLFKNLKFVINPSLEKRVSKIKKDLKDLNQIKAEFKKISQDLEDEDLKRLFSQLFESYLKLKFSNF